MSQKTYRIDYADNGSAEITTQAETAVTNANDNRVGHMPPVYGGYPYPYKEPPRMPALVNTGLTVVFAAICFFGAERFAPMEYKPSTLVGGYEASIGTQLKAAELNEQARFEAYHAGVRVAAETQVKETEKLLEQIAQYYQELHTRGRIMAQAASEIQGRYVAERMSQAGQIQSADMSIISLSTLIGRGLNIVEPGMGDPALDYAEQLEQGVVQGLTQAAQEGTRVDLHDWDLGVPEPSEVARLVARVPVMEIPEPPPLARHSNAAESREDSASRNGGR